jgi:hypothetical protein
MYRANYSFAEFLFETSKNEFVKVSSKTYYKSCNLILAITSTSS